MFKVVKSLIIARDKKKYLSFPDIIKSPKADNRFFLVYREGDSHHPVWSSLVLMRSDDNGESWSKQQEFPLKIKKDNYAWNCPRLSYIDDILYITCDQKSSIFERTAQFKIVHLTSKTEGEFFRLQETPIPGMVPDKIIEFKDKFLCANHKIKDSRNRLIQLISWSRYRGRLWYDTNIMINDVDMQFCEASVVNMGDYLIAYLRDNSGHRRYINTVTSVDGIYWSRPHALPIFGQRVTAIREKDKVIGAYRNTDVMFETIDAIPHQVCKVSVFEHDISNDKIDVSHIDWEYAENQYHFGYTGMAKASENLYMVTYYIKQEQDNPYIKLSFIERTKE